MTEVDKNFPVLDIFLWDINRDPLPQFFSKYQNWYLTPCCGHINFDIWIWGDPIYIPWILPKEGKVLCHLGLKSKVMAGPLTDLTPFHNFFPNIKIDIWHPAVGLRCIIPPRHWSQLKTRAIPLQGVKYQLWYLDLGGSYIYPMKITEGRQSSLPLGA
jgi:hypothetical protein